MNKIALFFKRYAPLVNLAKWAGLAGLFVLLVILWRNGEDQHAVIAKAKADNAVLEKKIAGYEQDIKAIRDSEKAANDALEVERKKPATVQTITKFVKVPGAIQIVEVPGQPAHIEISGDPQKNLDALQDEGIKCQECENSLLARNAELTKKAGEMKAMTEERDHWKDTANGGTRWTRTKKGLKVDLGAVGGAMLGALVDRKHPARGAAIGAGAGAVGVQIFSW